MKKLLLIVSAIALLSGIAQAQNPIPKGTTTINTGLGLGESSIPVYFGMDFGIGYDLSLGFEGTFQDRTHHYNAWGFAGNCNYHFNRILNIPKNFDFYAGGSLNVYSYHYDNDYVDRESGLFPGVQVGGRYFFTPNFGLNLEFRGAGVISGGKFGVTFRF